jgi:hypothetical protein
MGGGLSRVCSVLALFALVACAPGLASPPAAGPQARNGQTPIKKLRKVQPAPVLAPPPRYGNKIVQRAAEAPLPVSPTDG